MGNKSMVSGVALQKLINGIEGAMSSKAKLDDEGNPIEIHVLADKSRSAKQIARDIQSAVATRFDLEVDHRIISIAQLNCKEIVQKNLRITLKGMEILSKGLDLDVKIGLCYKEKEYSGEHRDMNTVNNINRTVARATLKAVAGLIHEFADKEAALVIEDIESVTLCKTKVIVVAITYVDNSGERLLVGSATDLGETKETVVEAILDAVNKNIDEWIS